MRVLFSSKGPQPQLAMFRTTSTCGNATCSAAAQGGLLRVSLFLLHRDRSVRDSCASTCSSSFCASHGDSFPSVSSTSRGTTKYIPAKLTAVWLLVKLHLQERGAGGSRAPIIENCWKSENCRLNPRILCRAASVLAPGEGIAILFETQYCSIASPQRPPSIAILSIAG